VEGAGQLLLEAGRLREARSQFWREADEAERRGDREALARAALGLGGVWVHEHRSLVERTRVLEVQARALAGLDPGSDLVPRLRTRLSAEEAYLTQVPDAVLDELVQARRRGDAVAYAEALSLAHHLLLGPDHSSRRLAVADELIRVSAATQRPRDMSHGLVWRTVDLFLAGDRHAPRSLAELREWLELHPCACFSYVVDALDVMLAIRAGKLKDAEQKAEACYTLGLDVGDADAIGWYGAHLVAIYWFQGRADEVLPIVADMTHSTTLATPNEAFFAALAVLAVAAGEVDHARAALASLTLNGLASIPRSSNWLATMLGVCEAAHLLGDVTAAGEAYRLLHPHAGLPVMVSLAISCLGSAHRPLGLAAATTGDLDEAVAQLEAALVADLSVGHGPAHVMDSMALADLLDRRREGGDTTRAAAVRTAAIAEARRYEMDARAHGWAEAVDASRSPPAVSCERVGPDWHVRVDVRTAVVPHSVGITYLAALVARGGEQIPSLELASGHALTLRGVAPEPVLDERAKAEYRRRIEELQNDIDVAEVDADLERAARARIELDRYLGELTRATGLFGRTRTFDDDAERARVSVTKALNRALSQLERADASVAGEIRSRLVTGVRCTFLTRRRD
jgi:hypothetical protein